MIRLAIAAAFLALCACAHRSMAFAAANAIDCRPAIMKPVPSDPTGRTFDGCGKTVVCDRYASGVICRETAESIARRLAEDSAECKENEAKMREHIRALVAELSQCAPEDAVVECDRCGDDRGACLARVCNREVECISDGLQPICEETPRSKELQAAFDRLALETNCARENIELVSQSEWRVGTETAFRMSACGGDYVCTIAAGRVECKTALSGQAASQPSL